MSPVTMETQWSQWAESEPLSGGRIWGWTQKCWPGCGGGPASLSGSEWLKMALGTGTAQTLVLGWNKAETLLS